MTQKTPIFVLLTLLAFQFAVAAPAASVRENIISKDKGFFTCGGGAVSFFKQDCLEVIVDRVSFGGGITYEGSCLDSNGKKYILACGNFSFEPEKTISNTKKNYFDPQ